MSASKPPVSLDQSCTVIYDGTLYSFSPDGFQSIRLAEGAVWKKLDMGVKVTGATCVGSDRPTNVDPAFFVVGGQSSSEDYTGLQKFTYSTGKWTIVTPTNLITKHRQWHTSAYIEADDSILVFGGNQDGKMSSASDTFSIKASEPYTVTPHPPPGAPNDPPACLRPIICRWTNSDAIMVGGGTSPDHTQIFFFNPNAGWRHSGASLAAALPKDTNSIQGFCVTGSDESISMLLFDLSQSPNKVTRVTIRDAHGSPVVKSPVITRRGLSNELRVEKRDLTLSNWPKYNATLAPKETRQGFASASDNKGMVVFSGGGSQSPLAMFDTANNGWMNATSFFSPDEKILTAASTTSTTSASSSRTSNSASSTSSITDIPLLTSLPETSNRPEDTGMSTNAILGISLGSIAGFLVLLGLILFLLRRRGKALSQPEAGKSNSPSNEKDMSPFFDRRTFSPANLVRGHRPQPSTESYSSVAILMGRMNKEKPGLSKKPSNETARSSSSSLHKEFKSTISKPIPQITHHPALRFDDDDYEREPRFIAPPSESRPRNRPTEANDGMRRSSGWNRYWSGGSALQLLGFGNGKRATVVSDQSSRYSEPSNNARVTQDSATVPALHFDGQPLVNSVNTGSPVIAQQTAKMPFTESMSGTIERPISPVSGYSSGIPESIVDTWDPMNAHKPWGANRDIAHAQPLSSHQTLETPSGPRKQQRAPSGVSKQPQLATAAISDMSWLNLGDHARK